MLQQWNYAYIFASWHTHMHKNTVYTHEIDFRKLMASVCLVKKYNAIHAMNIRE